MNVLRTLVERLDTPVDPSTLSEVVEGVTSVLLTGPTRDDRVTTAGLSFLSTPSPAVNDVHWVTMLRSPEDVVRVWDEQVADAPASLSFVEVGATRRRPDTASLTETFRYSTTHTESPSNLTALGIRLIEGTASTTTADGQHRLWFESLSTLLQYVSIEAAFQFVHTLHSQFSGTDAAVCYHLDPALHETRTVYRLLSVCDVWMRVDADELVVQRR